MRSVMVPMQNTTMIIQALSQSRGSGFSASSRKNSISGASSRSYRAKASDRNSAGREITLVP
jgi:hypothetical protein